MTRTAFLLARFAEEENRIRAFMDSPTFPRGTVVRRHWAIQLADCEAKRQIVRQVSIIEWGGYAVRDFILDALSKPYANHPDFDPAW